MTKTQSFDLDLRHFIYETFSITASPPTARDMAEHFNCSLVEVEEALMRLADAHQIALAPGSFSIWMAHPFSGISTTYVAKVGAKKYWGN